MSEHIFRSRRRLTSSNLRFHSAKLFTKFVMLKAFLRLYLIDFSFVEMTVLCIKKLPQIIQIWRMIL